MSKAVRIREHLYAEIDALAKKERRSLISQIEVLLEQALKLNQEPNLIEVQGYVGGQPTGPKTMMPNPAKATPDRHVTPDFK